MQELDKFNFNINVIQNGLEKHMIFNIKNKLIFLDNFQFLCWLLDTLVKNLDKYAIRCRFGKLLDLVKQKRFYPYEYMNRFEKL